MTEELRNVERQLKESHDDRDSLRMLVTGLQEELEITTNAKKLWHSRYIEVSEENENLKIAIDLVNVDNTKLFDAWNIEAKNTETLTQDNQDLQWDIANLSESLIREQRIVDFLTGQRQDE
jgi:chromosome segregation ATPase